MPILDGSNVDPHPGDSVLARADLNKKASEEERDVLDKEFERWTVFLATDVGRSCAALADPMIEYCNYQLGLSASALCHALLISPELLAETRAEIRGKLMVWSMIKNRPAQLRGRLAEIEELTGKPSGGPAWETRKEVEKTT